MTLTEPFLRDRLRTGTRAAQDALDRAQRRFSLKDPDGLRRFLAAQSDALSALRTCDDALAPALDAALALLAEDLDDLGHDAPPKTWPRPRTDDALARGYVWHSQRMALRMMARALPEGGSGQSYLTAPRDAMADAVRHSGGDAGVRCGGRRDVAGGERLAGPVRNDLPRSCAPLTSMHVCRFRQSPAFSCATRRSRTGGIGNRRTPRCPQMHGSA